MKNTLTTIYVVRHGQSISNAKKNNIPPGEYGELQSPLTSLGRQQAREVAENLKNIHFDAIFSSDLNRARETAEIIAESKGMQVITESTIRERFWGNGDKGLSKKLRLEIEKGLKNLSDEEKLLYRYFPDGETGMEAVNRFLAFLDNIIPVYTNKTILVVNHGNIMRSLLIHLKWARHNEIPPGTIENTGYYILEYNGSDITVKKTYKVNKKDNNYEE